MTRARSNARAIAEGFKSPPVVEVSLAVSLDPLPRLGLIALADLWRTTYRTKLPVVEEQGTLTLPQESFDRPTDIEFPKFERLTSPPLPRLWFVDKEGRQLVQVQSDLFARNWRDLEQQSGYPLYETLRDAFREDFGKFAAYVAKNNLGVVRPTQVEISYINHVAATDVSDVLTFVSKGKGLLSRPEGANLSTQYVLSRDGVRIGRLHLQATTAIHRTSGRQIVALTITARGRPKTNDLAGVIDFLDFGAEASLEAFVTSTRPDMHKKWSAPR